MVDTVITQAEEKGESVFEFHVPDDLADSRYRLHVTQEDVRLYELDNTGQPWTIHKVVYRGNNVHGALSTSRTQSRGLSTLSTWSWSFLS